MFTVSRIANARLDNLALPSDRLALLRGVAAQRTGALLLTGPPGAGKAGVAEALAAELGHDLMRVDTGRVVSRFIGETEKNLDRLFTAAAARGGVLFFDEADALFGKRSDVQDSHDRYANLEVSYLLQKSERHPGLVIVAVDTHRNVDPALQRRWRCVVDLHWLPRRG